MRYKSCTRTVIACRTCNAKRQGSLAAPSKQRRDTQISRTECAHAQRILIKM